MIKRGPFDLKERGESIEPMFAPKSGKASRSKGSTGKNKLGPTMKLECHFLGGSTLDEILYAEAWGDAATRVDGQCVLGKLYKLIDCKYVAKTPQYSTSRLTYFVRLDPTTSIEECTTKPWTDIPAQHPITPIARLDGVNTSMQVCLAGIITQQPGVVSRETKFGQRDVCNAVVRQGTHDIRCSFWGENAIQLAKHFVRTPVMLQQVRVIRKDDESWEAGATEATMILTCPEPLKAELERTTVLSDTMVSLTRAVAFVDYDDVVSTVASLSGLQTIIVPNEAREIPGVYDVHNVAIMGVSSILAEDKLIMKCCANCKRRIEEGSSSCREHTDADVVPRWIFNLELADASGSAQMVAFHEVIDTLPDLPSDDSPVKAKQKFCAD